jgi:hypothetical protein
VCSMHGVAFQSGKLKQRGYLEDMGIDGIFIKKGFWRTCVCVCVYEETDSVYVI